METSGDELLICYSSTKDQEDVKEEWVKCVISPLRYTTHATC
jgi:hypothetical protein